MAGSDNVSTGMYNPFLYLYAFCAIFVDFVVGNHLLSRPFLGCAVPFSGGHNENWKFKMMPLELQKNVPIGIILENEYNNADDVIMINDLYWREDEEMKATG